MDDPLGDVHQAITAKRNNNPTNNHHAAGYYLLETDDGASLPHFLTNRQNIPNGAPRNSKVPDS